MVKAGFVVAFAVLMLGAAPAAADFDEGVAYYNDGDYFRALSELKPEAEAGNAIAQVYVAGIYQYGLVSSINYAEAYKWYELAARQDNVDGQIGLGVLYSLGQGVEKNLVEAYKWLRIAADRLPQGSDRSRVIGALDAISESMSKDDVEQANKLAKAWRPNP